MSRQEWTPSENATFNNGKAVYYDDYITDTSTLEDGKGQVRRGQKLHLVESRGSDIDVKCTVLGMCDSDTHGDDFPWLLVKTDSGAIKRFSYGVVYIELEEADEIIEGSADKPVDPYAEPSDSDNGDDDDEGGNGGGGGGGGLYPDTDEDSD